MSREIQVEVGLDDQISLCLTDGRGIGLPSVQTLQGAHWLTVKVRRLPLVLGCEI